MEVRVFTDGACENNGKKGAKASYAYWFPEYKELSFADRVPEDQSQTNQRGELLAIYFSIKKCLSHFGPDIRLHIYTDSMYSKNCLTSWLPKWQANSWKTSQGSLVAHKDIIEEMSTLLTKFNSYIITHVPTHTGLEDDLSKDNAVVDRMATEVIQPRDVKIVSTNTDVPIQGLPIALLGPPVPEKSLIMWCNQNLDKLDQDILETCLLTALSKTLKRKGFTLAKQRLHRSNLYRLNASNLISEGKVIIKDEEWKDE